MTFDRRTLMIGAGATAAITLLPGCKVAPDAAGPASDGAAAPAGQSGAARLLARMTDAILSEYPENATALGLDKDARAALKAQLTDHTPEGRKRRGDAAAARLAELQKIDTASLSPADRADVEVAKAAHQLAVDGFRFAFGDPIQLSQNWYYRNAPYVVAQNTGSFVEIPDFLDSSHVIANAADADAYLARLDAYAANLDGETARLAHDRGAGVIAPDFLLDKTLKQQKDARALPLEQWGLVGSIARRGKDMAGDPGSKALSIVRDKVAPAMDRQIAELETHRRGATGAAGVWKLSEGEAYYAWALRAGTTTEMTPDEVHQRGQEELKALQSRMDGLLRAQGLTQGSVGARMTALGKDPKNLFPNTDAGRREILAYINGKVDDIRGRLPRAFNTLVPGRLVVKRVPPEIEAGAPGGYAAAGAIDGSTPGNYYINLRDTGMWPRYSLPTLTYHEGIPGHIWQGEYTYKLPLIRSVLAFNAYSEGWALYAEQLGDELGVYEGDPLGQLGYLQSIAFRACRLVVDTGLHAKRWTRERAIQWFVETNGSTVEEVQGEVDRYCAWPGQACGYKIGHSEIVRLRDKARAEMDGRYDLKAFNDVVVKTGGVPITVLEQIVGEYSRA
ncbi:DUF885 domain-containing protein [Allosphingosinicella indica]|uniref:Uncharacterized conserved protein, DUF885 familyt n=1 Tax=Allosphingosinicella indica TaxID=941907 RepID=A0A1X7H383_9SPHN|nr:DUF885 family protein [Allosphingosinicella indica]SMF79045.1 Uncharacterized conserved protein, DUF885 familyt [Allosphingosinicella indica]